MSQMSDPDGMASHKQFHTKPHSEGVKSHQLLRQEGENTTFASHGIEESKESTESALYGFQPVIYTLHHRGKASAFVEGTPGSIRHLHLQGELWFEIDFGSRNDM